MRTLRRSRLLDALLLPGLLFLPSGAAAAIGAEACVYHQVMVEAAPSAAPASPDAEHPHAHHGAPAAPDAGSASSSGHGHHGGTAAAAADEAPSRQGCECDCALLCAAGSVTLGAAPAGAPAALPAAPTVRVVCAPSEPAAPRASGIAFFLPPAIAPPAT